jgi:hypothetical protein
LTATLIGAFLRQAARSPVILKDILVDVPCINDSSYHFLQFEDFSLPNTGELASE